MPDIKPISGPSTDSILPQAHMVTPAAVETPGTSEENARQGGRIYTCEHTETQTRPQEMHSSLHYQENTADPGAKPEFYDYTELTMRRGEVKG